MTAETARNWWLRSPNPSNCNNVRNCTAAGALNNNNANNTYGAVDDCEMRVRVGIVPKRCTH